MALPRCFAPSQPKPPSQCHPNTQLTIIARNNTIIVGQSTMVQAVVTRDCFSGWVFALRASHIVVCAVHYTGYSYPVVGILGVGHMWKVVFPWEGYPQHDNERV